MYTIQQQNTQLINIMQEISKQYNNEKHTIQQKQLMTLQQKINQHTTF